MISYLSDTSYIGKYKLYRKNEYIYDYIPRILEEDLWNSVQRLRKKKEKQTSKITQTSLFSGLLYCAECGIRMVKKQDNRCKNIVMRYVCDNSYRKKVGSLEFKCNNRISIREEEIESFLLDNIKELAQKHILKNTVTKSTPKQNNKAKINELENKIYKLKDLYLDDLIDKETYKNDYARLTSELQKLKSINVEVVQKDFSHLENFINQNLVDIYNQLELDEKRRFWLEIIDKIYINKGKIEDVTFL